MLGANFHGNLCKRLGLLGPSFPFVSFISTVPAFGLFPKLRLNLLIRTTSQNVVKVKTSGFPILLLQKAIPLVNMEPERAQSILAKRREHGKEMCFLSSLCVFPGALPSNNSRNSPLYHTGKGPRASQHELSDDMALRL